MIPSGIISLPNLSNHAMIPLGNIFILLGPLIPLGNIP